MKKITLIIAAAAAMGLSSCKKYLDQSVNPNSPSQAQVTLPLLLTGAETVMSDMPNGYGPTPSSAGGYGGGGLYENYGMWVGYWAPSPGYIIQPNLQEYIFTTTSFQPWTDLYLNLSNINNMQVLATSQGATYYQAMAMIMKAYDFQQLVDNYNDVPYSQAFQANTNLFPTYDKGPAIYADLIKQLDNAIAMINAGKSTAAPGSDDVIFQGNMTNWKKFANTLKLRLILRQSNLSNFSSIAADMASTVNEGFLDATTQAQAQPGFTLSDAYGGQESPFWHSYGTDQNGNPTGSNSFVKANEFSVNLLNSFNDPRINYIYQPITVKGKTGVFGVYLGDPALNTLTASQVSKIGPGLLQSASQPAVIFSGAESLFLQAEATMRNIISGTYTAQQYYEQGITASFAALGLTAAQAQAYYNQNIANVGWNASSQNYLQAIITQKYIALNGYGAFEAYNEFRRTGYPAPASVLRSKDPLAIGTGIPSRIFYPQTEYSTNSQNVAAEGTIDAFNSLIFWAVNQNGK